MRNLRWASMGQLGVAPVKGSLRRTTSVSSVRKASSMRRLPDYVPPPAFRRGRVNKGKNAVDDSIEGWKVGYAGGVLTQQAGKYDDFFKAIDSGKAYGNAKKSLDNVFAKGDGMPGPSSKALDKQKVTETVRVGKSITDVSDPTPPALPPRPPAPKSYVQMADDALKQVDDRLTTINNRFDKVNNVINKAESGVIKFREGYTKVKNAGLFIAGIGMPASQFYSAAQTGAETGKMFEEGKASRLQQDVASRRDTLNALITNLQQELEGLDIESKSETIVKRRAQLEKQIESYRALLNNLLSVTPS